MRGWRIARPHPSSGSPQIETAIALTGGRVTDGDLRGLIGLAKQMLTAPAGYTKK
jgi:hypothetical protein